MNHWNPETDYWCQGGAYYEHVCEECGIDFKSSREWSTLCKACWKDSQGFDQDATTQASTVPQPFIPDEMLKRILQLCHPDRHGGSEASHKATQWLLDQRRR